MPDLFYHPAEDSRPEPHAYRGCGLDDIFLLNGYEMHTHDGEEHMAVRDVEGLHQAIGRHLVLHRKKLAPKEGKFLRRTMNMTQAELAGKLGNDAQSVARWEKGVCEMPGSAEKLLKALFLANNVLDENEDFSVLKHLLVSAPEDPMDEAPRQTSFRLEKRWTEAERIAA